MTRKLDKLQLAVTDTPESNRIAFNAIRTKINQLIDSLEDVPAGAGTPGEQGLQGIPGVAGAAGAPGADGAPASLVSDSLSFLVPVESPGVWSVGEVEVAKKAMLYRVEADQSCIVRLYFNEALRDIDAAAARLPTTNPGPGYILAEVGLDLSNGRSQYLSPVPMIYNADEPATSIIYWAVQQTMLLPVEVNVVLSFLPLEA